MSDRSNPVRRVWIVNHYAAAPDEPAGTRHYELARRLVARGYEVTIFAASFGHHSGRERHLRDRALAKVDQRSGVRFVWLRTIPYQGNTWRRQANMLSFLAVFLVAQTRRASPDAVIGSTVHPFAAIAAWFAARTRGARFIFEIRDLWPQTLVDLGAMREGSASERLLWQLEAFLVRRADAVISLLPGIRDYLVERGLPAEHITYIPNGVDVDAFLEPSSEADPPESVRAALAAIARLQGEGRFVLGYIGAFGRVNRVDLIVEAAALAEQLEPGRVGVVVIGEGPERALVDRQAGGNTAAAICRPVPKHHVPAILNALDGTIVHTTYTPVYRYGISFNKLFEYMAAGRPIVFACDTAYDPVVGSGAGITIRPDDPEALAAAFLALAGMTPEARAAMGTAGRRHVARLHDFGRLADTLNEIVQGRLPPRL